MKVHFGLGGFAGAEPAEGTSRPSTRTVSAWKLAISGSRFLRDLMKFLLTEPAVSAKK